jgi:hypothetical protein
MDLPSGSISHAVSPVARVLPDLRAGGGLGRPCGNSGSYVVLRTFASHTEDYRVRSVAPTHRMSTRREPVKQFLNTRPSPTLFGT